jgi:ACS family hexuronate transporter-like MFS transporter
MRLPERKWWICGLLLLATMINYMDRQTMANTAAMIINDLKLSKAEYGHMETGFGIAFAVGSLIFGFVAERMSVRRLYPLVLMGWSLAAVASAWTHTFGQFLACRIIFGLFESAHWPCAMKVTFATLDAKDRTMGNSLVQSGASVASIITPQLLKLMLTAEDSSWRGAFQIVGFSGMAWIVVWFAVIRHGDLQPQHVKPANGPALDLGTIIRSGRFWAIALLIIGAQTCWQLFRVWLPLFLEQGRGYSKNEVKDLTSLYYIAADAGCILAGVFSLWLVKHWKLTTHMGKRRVYQACTLLTCSAALIPWLGRGLALDAVILVVGVGALGLFPCYYSFVQDLSDHHVGSLIGLMSMWVWAVTSPMHSAFGAWIDRTHSFDLGMAVAGLMPLLGVVSLAVLWKEEPSSKTA